MEDQGNEYSFFQGIHARIDIRIDISISIRSWTTKIGMLVHVQDLTKMRPMKQILVTLLGQNQVTN